MTPRPDVRVDTTIRLLRRGELARMSWHDRQQRARRLAQVVQQLGAEREQQSWTRAVVAPEPPSRRQRPHGHHFPPTARRDPSQWPPPH